MAKKRMKTKEDTKIKKVVPKTNTKTQKVVFKNNEVAEVKKNKEPKNNEIIEQLDKIFHLKQKSN